MPKYTTAADRIADGLFAAKNRMFEFIQQKLDEGISEKEIMKELKETVTADPLMLAEIEQTFFKKKAKNADIVEDGYAVSIPELNETIDSWVRDQLTVQNTIDDAALISKLESYYGFESIDAPNVLEHYYHSYDGKDEAIKWNKPIKSAKFNPYKKAVDVTELFKEYDAIMDAATDMRTEGIISDEEYTSIDKAHKSIDDPAHIVSYLEELKELMEKAMATSKAASWIDDAKVGDKVELNDETGEVVYIGNDKIEVKTPTKTETIWKN